jgi:hypothetical protein
MLRCGSQRKHHGACADVSPTAPRVVKPRGHGVQLRPAPSDTDVLGHGAQSAADVAPVRSAVVPSAQRLQPCADVRPSWSLYSFSPHARHPRPSPAPTLPRGHGAHATAGTAAVGSDHVPSAQLRHDVEPLSLAKLFGDGHTRHGSPLAVNHPGRHASQRVLLAVTTCPGPHAVQLALALRVDTLSRGQREQAAPGTALKNPGRQGSHV